MGYLINIEIDGYEFQFGELNYHNHGKGVWIDFENEKIKKYFEHNDPKFVSALASLFEQHEEIDAIATMNGFERNYLQGYGWYSLTKNYSFSGLEKFKRKALIVLNSYRADEEQKLVAQTIIDVLNGDYESPPPPEKTPEEKSKSIFERKKPKLRTKLVIRDGYKCDNCGNDKEDSLCITQKQIDKMNYELENLTLRCRSCMNKMKKK